MNAPWKAEGISRATWYRRRRAARDEVLPGGKRSHEHADRPNWRPAETLEEYDENVRAGLEEFTEKRFLELSGLTRAQLWRCRMFAKIPDELFDRLNQEATPSTTELAYVGAALSGRGPALWEVEHCPHCGEVLRERYRVSDRVCEIVKRWETERAGRGAR